MKKMNEVDADVLRVIPIGHEYGISKQALMDATGYDERLIRKAVSDLRREITILNMQDGSGYFIPGPGDERLVERYIQQETNRAKAIFTSLKAARDFVDDQIPGQVTVEEAIEMFESIAKNVAQWR